MSGANMSGRLTTGANRQPSAYDANTRVDPYPLPAASIIPDPLPEFRKRPEGALLTIVLSVFVCLMFSAVGLMMNIR